MAPVGMVSMTGWFTAPEVGIISLIVFLIISITLVALCNGCKRWVSASSLIPWRTAAAIYPFHKSVGGSMTTDLQDLNHHLRLHQHNLLDLMDSVWSRAFPVWWFHPRAGVYSHLRFKADGPALDPIPGCHNEAFVCMGVLNAHRNYLYTSGPVRVLHTLHGCDTQVDWNYGLISCFFTFQNA